jgi:hypothetical protein
MEACIVRQRLQLVRQDRATERKAAAIAEERAGTWLARSGEISS